MPRYELAVIYRLMERPQLTEAIRRTSELILNNGGIIRAFDNVGVRKLPYKMFKHGNGYESGSYLLVQFDSTPTLPKKLSETLHLDTDVVRPRVLRMERETGRPCETRACDFGEMNEDMRIRLREDLKKFIEKL